MPDVEKRYPATPHRRREARERGQVVKSIEVNTVFILLLGFIFFRFFSGYMVYILKEFMHSSFTFIPSNDFTLDTIYPYGVNLIIKFAMIVIPFCLTIGVIAILSNVLQVGFLTSWFVIKPQLTRINPIDGFRRIFSYRALVELIKSILKIIVTVWVCYLVIRSETTKLVYTISMEPNSTAYFLGKVIFSLIFKVSLSLLALAIVDYFYQRWEYEKSLRMTREELKEELIRYEGRPEVKQRIRALQRQLARRRMMEEVKRADVVITNPTRLAIAIRYDPKESLAPKVVAKGERFIAEKIIARAKEFDIPIVENKPLAWALYKMVEIGSVIPIELYQAVAEVLAYLFRIGKAKRKWV
ncbi:MAG: flagellar biosynthesis protein FlhB [Candidatus Omnitrophica bacterium]|nr:flagellar biosynthesis protein FlhB [Candidatus Omnitrophota bacterium]